MPTYVADTGYLQNDLDDIDRRLSLLEQARPGGGDSSGTTNTGAIGSTTTAATGTPASAYGSGGTSASMVVGQIIGTQIANGVVTTAHIIASGISGTVIQANTLLASAIATSTLNATTLITAPATTGTRVEIDGRTATTGIRLYNSAGTNTFNADAVTGNVTIVGTLKTAATGMRWEISTSAADKIDGYTGDASEDIASNLHVAINGTGTTRVAGLAIVPPRLGTTGIAWNAALLLNSNSPNGAVGSSATLSGDNVYINGSTQTSGFVTISASGTAGGGQLGLHDTTTNTSKFFRCNNNLLEIVNGGYTAVIASLSDAGALQAVDFGVAGSPISIPGRIELRGNWITTPAGLAGGAAPALPAQPLGYALLTANNGAKIAVPYYATTS